MVDVILNGKHNVILRVVGAGDYYHIIANLENLLIEADKLEP